MIGNQVRHFYGIEYPVGKISNDFTEMLKVELAAFLSIDARLDWLKKDPENRTEIAAKDVKKLITYQYVNTITYSFI